MTEVAIQKEKATIQMTLLSMELRKELKAPLTHINTSKNVQNWTTVKKEAIQTVTQTAQQTLL